MPLLFIALLSCPLLGQAKQFFKRMTISSFHNFQFVSKVAIYSIASSTASQIESQTETLHSETLPSLPATFSSNLEKSIEFCNSQSTRLTLLKMPRCDSVKGALTHPTAEQGSFVISGERVFELAPVRQPKKHSTWKLCLT